MREKILSAAVALLVCAGIVGCTEPKPKSDAELGLTPQQAAGRRVYDLRCLACHAAYSRSGKNGPSLKGIYGKPYFPSGTPANDERMTDIILLGRPMMPAFRNQLTKQELDDLLAYLHTL
ncbi:MAG TPA: cytochrome c [Terriglobales bacterium]|nr:cytochrome c [Terriglobales bacterium]